MDLRARAEETRRVVERGGYDRADGVRVDLSAAISAARMGTRLYRPAELETLVSSMNLVDGRAARVEVTDGSAAEAGLRLVRKEDEEDVAILNFASAKNPGGGWLGGALAQEEDLTRASALATCAPPNGPGMRICARQCMRTPPTLTGADGHRLPEPPPLLYCRAEMKKEPAKSTLDPREVGTYTVSEAAHYLRIPQATLRSWFFGTHYMTQTGRKFFRPPLSPTPEGGSLLSFMNMVEAHVLDAIRREHSLPLQKVRRALAFIKSEFKSGHPLVEHRFMTDGVELFMDRVGALVSASEHGQQAIREALEGYLNRIERDEMGLAIRLYPYTRKRDLNEPKVIVIDPRVSFGRPVLAGTGIATAVIADRYKAGESIEQLADDYGRKPLEIQEAIRCELQLDAA